VSENFTPTPQTVNLESGGVDFRAERLKILLESTGGAKPVSPDRIALSPCSVYLGEVR
jgi:hypothetical protein